MKEQIIKEYGRTEGDTGSAEVQIAILTKKQLKKNYFFSGGNEYRGM